MTGGPRIAILGTGALATLFAARLGRGHRVAVGGSWPEGLAALRRGARVDGEPGDVALDARPLGALDGAHDLVLVLVKAQHTADVAPHAARLVAPDGVILTLQNGLGVRERLAAAAAPAPVAAGVTTLGATLIAPGLVRAWPGRVVIEDRPAPAMAQTALALCDAGFATETVKDLAPHAWRKLAVNCALNALTALVGVANGAVLDDPERRRLVERAAQEVAAVAAARGVVLEDDAAAAALDVAARTAGNRSSMLQDLDRGATTEIEFLNGAVEREAARLGVPAPVNRWLANEVRLRERSAALA